MVLPVPLEGFWGDSWGSIEMSPRTSISSVQRGAGGPPALPGNAAFPTFLPSCRILLFLCALGVLSVPFSSASLHICKRQEIDSSRFFRHSPQSSLENWAFHVGYWTLSRPLLPSQPSHLPVKSLAPAPRPQPLTRRPESPRAPCETGHRPAKATSRSSRPATCPSRNAAPHTSAPESNETPTSPPESHGRHRR